MDLLLLLIVVVVLVVYLVASHKISTATLHAKLDSVLQQLHLVHAAAQAPVLVAPAPVAPPADFSPTPPAGVPIPPPSPAGPPAAAVPTAPAPGANTTDPTAPGFVRPAAAPTPAAPEPVTVRIDTTPEELDYNVVGNGVEIVLRPGQLRKVIRNCPVPTRVGTVLKSDSPGASAYTLFVNDVEVGKRGFDGTGTLETSLFTSANGPTLVVEVRGDNPFLTLELEQG